MQRLTTWIVLLPLATGLIAAEGANPPKTLTGWFSCAKCHTAQPSSKVTAPNPDCSRDCIKAGSGVVFLSEGDQSLYRVQGFEKAIDELGYHEEVIASVDVAAKTMTVKSVKRLGDYQGAACTRPKKKQ